MENILDPHKQYNAMMLRPEKLNVDVTPLKHKTVPGSG
jgi:hypothetical protein